MRVCVCAHTWPPSVNVSVNRTPGAKFQNPSRKPSCRSAWGCLPEHAWAVKVEDLGCRVQGSCCSVQRARLRFVGSGLNLWTPFIGVLTANTLCDPKTLTSQKYTACEVVQDFLPPLQQNRCCRCRGFGHHHEAGSRLWRIVRITVPFQGTANAFHQIPPQA